MRKMIAVATLSLIVGGLIGAYGFHGQAEAASQDSCSHKAVVQFGAATLGRGATIPVPQGCTDELLVQLYLAVHAMSGREQTQSSSSEMRLGTLEARVEGLCRQIPQIRC